METSVLERQRTLPHIQEKAVEIFGKTEDPLKARFILFDGSFLLMPGGYVNKDHHRITRAYPVGTTPGEAILQFMNSGAIRFGRWPNHTPGYSALAEFTRVPNDEQLAVLKRNTVGLEKVALDLINPDDGHRILSEVLDFPRAFDVRDFISRAKGILEQRT